MIGVVLSGGLSSRMGKDKGLIQTNHQAWASLAAEKIASLAIPAVVSVNRFQLPAYLKIFGSKTLIADDETLNVKGPLCGILSVHKKYRAEDMMVIACDMQTLNTLMLQQLIRLYNEHPGFEAWVYKSNEGFEPLVAIYSSVGLRKILESARTGKLKKFSMQSVLEKLNVFPVEIASQDKQFFQNFNEPGDLEGMNKPNS